MNDNILDLLNKEIQEHEMHKANIEQGLTEVNKELKRLRRTKDAYLGQKASKPAKKTIGHKPGRPPQGFNEVLEVMRANPESEFSAPGLSEHVNISQTTLNKVLASLREKGKIDLVRQGGRTGTTKFYKLAIGERIANDV